MSWFSGGIVATAILLLSTFFVQGFMYSNALNAFAQSDNSTQGNNTDSSLGGNATSPGNVTDGESSIPSIENDTDDGLTEDLTNDTAGGALNLTDIAPSATGGLITIKQTGLANETGNGDGLYGLTLSVSGRYSFNPATGIEVNQTVGQLVIEGSSSATEETDQNQTSGLTGNTSQSVDAQIVATRFNLTNTIITISEDLRNVTIASAINEITDGEGNGVTGDTLSSLSFEFPIDLTADGETSNTTAGGENTVQAIVGNFNYESSPATTEGQLVVDVDAVTALEQELDALTQSDQLEEDIVNANSTLPERIQDAVFQTLNLTVPTTSEVEENITNADGNVTDANATFNIVETRINPLLQSASEEQIANLTEDQQTLFEAIRDSLTEDDLTESQKIQVSAFLDQLANQSAADSTVDRLDDIVVGIGAILLAGVNDSGNLPATSTAAPYAESGRINYIATGFYTADASSADGENVRSVFLGAIFLAILPALFGAILDWMRDKIPPTISAPPDILDEVATGLCTPVDLFKYGYPNAYDDKDQSPDIIHDAPSCFPVGISYVTWTAFDDAGLSSSDTQAIVVNERLERSFSIYQSGIATLGETGGSDECEQMPISSVRASGDDGNVPANTLDNNLGTRWSGFGIGSWIQLDLGEDKMICSIDIAWYRGDVRSNNFAVSISDDGDEYETVYSDTSSGTTTSAETYDIPDTYGRYVEIAVYGNTINNWASLTEIGVNGREVPSAAVIQFQMSGTYQYDQIAGQIETNPSEVEATITVLDDASGNLVEMHDLSPINIEITQQNMRITIEAQIDSPSVTDSSVLSSLRFTYPIDFMNGGSFYASDEVNTLTANVDGNIYETGTTSYGWIDISVPLACVIIQSACIVITSLIVEDEPAIPQQEEGSADDGSADDGPTGVATGPIEGTEGDDSLQGSEEADEIHGLGGDDQITGLGGDDILDGGAGDNDLDGGDGNDRITSTVDFFDESEWGYNTIIAGDGADDIELVQTGGNISTGNGNDRIRAVADSGTVDPFWISAGEGEDFIEAVDTRAVIYGEGGNDEIHAGGETLHTVYGGADDDELYLETDIGGELFGEGGDDFLSSLFGGTLDGGDGDDTIETRGGGDFFTFTGGQGADHFICTDVDEETITDFDPDEGDTTEGGCDNP